MACFFQAATWFACTSNRLANSDNVPSPRIAANATFARKGPENARHFLDMNPPPAVLIGPIANLPYRRAQFFQTIIQPLTGHGFGQFPIKNLPYLNDRSYGFSLQTIRGYIHHNTFLSILVELGLVGFVLYLWMLAAWAYAARKVWRDDQQPEWARGFGLFFLVLWVTAATQGFFHEVSISPLENGILFLAAGLTMALRNIQPQCSAIGRHPLESGYQTPTTGWMTGRGMAT